MADTPLKKFMFERSFDNARDIAPVRDRRPVTYTPDQIDALKKEVHDAAFAAGKKSALDDNAQKLNASIAQMGATIAQLLEQAEAARKAQEPRVREAVMAIAKKVLPDFAQRHGLEEIQAVVAGVIGEMSNEPRLVVRVNETQFDSIDANLKTITEQQGYTGKVVLIVDAQVAPGDCRIEWADGGIERNIEALWKNVGKTVAPDAGPLPEPAVETAATAETPAASTEAPAVPNTASSS